MLECSTGTPRRVFEGSVIFVPVEGKLSSAVGQEAPVLGGEHTPELTPTFRQQDLVGSGTSMIQAPV